MKYTYTTHGVCSRQIVLDLDGTTIKEAKFIGGCHGNTQGISALVKGMDAEDVIERLEGINCGGRGTSCPDQLSSALKEALEL